MHVARLIVQSARDDDVLKDIARVCRDDRGALRTGRFHRFSVNGCGAYLILRGVSARRKGCILLDAEMRGHLRVQSGSPYDFQIAEAGFWGELRWGWSATDPAYRAASRAAAISVGIGTLSLLLGALGLWVAVKG